MLRYTARTDRGCRREKNEDRFYVPPENGPFLFAVADGMGGHAAGEVASSIAVNLLERKYGEQLEILLRGDPQACQVFLQDMIRDAHEEILAAQRENSAYKGMGTTMTAILLAGEDFLVGHVGDSQVHLMNKEICRQVTEDHSMVNMLLKSGEITPEEAENHPQRNMLTSALGAITPYKADFYRFTPRQGDDIILCSDGLTAMLKPEEIKRIINRFTDIESAADELLNQANVSGGLDNITFIIIRFV